MEFEDEVDLLMTSDIVSAQISTKPITFTKAQTGWIFKEDRKEFSHYCSVRSFTPIEPFCKELLSATLA